jgi:uncharacterized repeat protein (TIGR03803 family)
MSKVDRSRKRARAYHHAVCERLEPRVLLAADSFTFVSVASFQTKLTGAQPQGLIEDAAGNIYGVTALGGTKNYGTVFKIDAVTGTITTLASFTGGKTMGTMPKGDLYLDSAGNLFGTTVGGGAYDKGTIFEIAVGGNATSSTITTIASFNGTNGSYPYAGLVADAAGNLYGTTMGSKNRGYASTVWELASGSSEITVLATFSYKMSLAEQLATTSDGLLATDAAGNIFGTTRLGGTKNGGTLFEISTDHSVTTLVNFTGTTGYNPAGTLLRESDGTFLGTTYNGGHNGYGTIFQLSTSSTLSVLGTFTGKNGAHPIGKLIVDSAGNLFGVTTIGGSKGYGTVFELPAGTASTITTLYSINNVHQARNPSGPLVVDADGDFWVATYDGGAKNAGAIFELRANTTVYAQPPEPAAASAAASVAHLSVAQQPATVSAGASFELQVEVLNAVNGLATTTTGTATLSITSGPGGGVLMGVLSATIVNGVADFSGAILSTPGVYTLQVSVPSLGSVFSNAITVL